MTPQTSKDISEDKHNEAQKAYTYIQPLVKSGKNDLAIMALEKIVGAYPDFAPAHNDLGVLYYKTGNKEKALIHYGNAVRIKPEEITYQKNMADFYYMEMDRTKEALEIYLGILQKYPEDIETLLVIGNICISLDEFKDAKVFYNRVLELEPWNSHAWQSLQELQKVEKELSKSNTPQDMYTEILPLIKSGQTDQAISSLENLTALFPGYALAYNDLGVLYFRKGDKKKALENYEKATLADPQELTFRKNLADFYFVEQNQVEEAMKIYLDILRDKPEDVEVLLAIGNICVSIEKYDDAKVFFNRVLDIEPWNMTADKCLEGINKNEQK